MYTVSVDLDRDVSAPVETSRRTLLSALSALGFGIERSDATSLRAQRGSAWLGGVRPDKRPVTADASFLSGGRGTTIHLHLTGTGQFHGGALAVSHYAPLFQTVHDTVDSWLLALDPEVATSPLPQPELRHTHTAGSKTAAAAARQLGASHLAERLHREPWVWVMVPDAAAPLSMNDAQMCLAVAAMITADPTILPPAMMQQLARVTLALRRGVESATPPAVRVDIDGTDKKVVELLFRQSLIRQGLPVREVHCCRDCSQERVVNPDYQVRARRNRRISDLMGVVGVTIGRSPQVFAVAGRLFNMKMLAPPEFVCTRCQGTEADVALATMCPQCHAIRREPLLLLCPTKDCGYDFRARAAGASPWQALDVTQPAPIEAPEAAGAAPGWYPDPLGRHQLRWFDGSWSSHAADGEVVVEDELCPQ